MSKYLNRALLFIALGSMCSPVLSTENVAGDDLDFFHPERKSVQVSPLNIIDIRGKELSDPIVVKAAELDVAHELEQLESSPAKEIAQSMAPFAIANERKLVPEFVAMMEAHARNAGVNLEVLYASSLNPDLEIEVGIGVDFSEQLRLIKGCTTMAFPNGLVGQTLDWPVESINDNTSVLLSDQVIATMGGAAIYQQMGRNVGVTVNHMGGLSDPDPRDPQNVVSLGAMLYAMALSDSVDHAIKIAEKYTTPIAFNFTLADKGGSTALVEMLAGGARVERGGNRGVAHANHTPELRQYYALNTDNYSEINKKLVWTFAREDAANFFLKYTPEFTVETMKFLFGQRPVNMTMYQGDGFVTVQAFVFDLNEGCIHITGDNPRFNDYRKVCFDQ